MNAAAYTAYERHVNPTLGAFLRVSGRDVRFVRATGSTLEDDTGRRWEDWVSGFGAFSLGHNPPALRAVMQEHLASEAPMLFVEQLNPYAGALAARLARATGGAFETCLFGNSGAEAVEAALKTAMLVTGRSRIAYADGAYHGTTLGALACMARGPYRADLDRALAPFVEVPFGDVAALEKALAGGDVAAFIVEPIQVEAGVRIAPPGYLDGARAACRGAGALLVVDEVQTGLGRTGALFASHPGVASDVLILAKALGGGLMPIGATLLADGLWERAYGPHLKSEIHASTFGGNSLACRAALATLDVVEDAAFLAGVRARGAALFSALEAALAGSPSVERVSWRGLLGGIVLRAARHPWVAWENLGLPELAGQPAAGALVIERLARQSILAQVCAHDWSVVRVQPALTVDEAACARFVAAVTDAIAWLDDNG